ncbi:hypothetical protein INR49_017195 [Caranx melampygus]|nr:hypothetical protein INR49_017195 [Caranx melampygus]
MREWKGGWRKEERRGEQSRAEERRGEERRGEQRRGGERGGCNEGYVHRIHPAVDQKTPTSPLPTTTTR